MNTLIIQLTLLQVAMPLLLIGLHALVKVASMAGWWARTLGIVLLLLLVALTGVWLFPPWWTPWILAVLHMLASARALIRYRRRSASCARWHQVAEISLGLLLCIAVTVMLLPAVEGGRVPTDVIALAAPFESGRYLVTSGGTTGTINSHLKTLTGDRFVAYRGQSYAVDLIGINWWGLRTAGISPADPRRYVIYGRTVTAPCTGTVAIAVDGVADMPVPEMDRQNMLGNHVIINCQGGGCSACAPGTRVAPRLDR